MKPVLLNDVSHESVSSVCNGDDRVTWSPLSSVQRSFWFLYKLRPDFQGMFNNVLVTRTTPALEPDKLQYALDRLSTRHPLLRACFSEIDGEPVQRIEQAVSIPLQVVEVEDLDSPELVATTTLTLTADSIGQWIGTGKGRGLGFLFILSGLFSMLITMVFLMGSRIQKLENVRTALKKSDID